jgi:hypothetical protein
MLAAWYERPGPAAEVLQVGEIADPQPGHDAVRVRVALSGVNPGDAKKRDEARRQAAADLTRAAGGGALSIPIGEPLPLHRIAEAHERVDAGARERVPLSIPR